MKRYDLPAALFCALLFLALLPLAGDLTAHSLAIGVLFTWIVAFRRRLPEWLTAIEQWLDSLPDE